MRDPFNEFLRGQKAEGPLLSTLARACPAQRPAHLPQEAEHKAHRQQTARLVSI